MWRWNIYNDRFWFFFFKKSFFLVESIVNPDEKKKNKAKLIQARVRNITDRLPKYLVIDGFLVD